MGLEALYGGAAGGGKSDALLMGALQFAHVPGYAALLLRQSFSDLKKPESLIPRSHAWLGGKAVYKAQDHAWTIPTPCGGESTISFGYLEGEKDVYQYQGAAFQFIGFDELTQFRLSDYRYLFSRLRRPLGMNVPLRMRSGSNPGGVGHDWVKSRFMTEGALKGRYFVPARLYDNPSNDIKAYRRSLRELDPITRKQLEDGDWTVRAAGGFFKREKFDVQESCPVEWEMLCRFWDLAATAESQKNKDPDYTCGVLLGLKDGYWWVLEVRRKQAAPADVELMIKQCAMVDNADVIIGMEQEGGASGKSLVHHYASTVLSGFNFRGVPSQTNKIARAHAFSAATENGLVKVLKAPWNGTFLDEMEAFPQGAHDDVVDGCSGAMNLIKTASIIMVV